MLLYWVVTFPLSASQPLLTLASGEDIPKLFGMALEVIIPGPTFSLSDRFGEGERPSLAR